MDTKVFRKISYGEYIVRDKSEARWPLNLHSGGGTCTAHRGRLV
jgi:hypothetical protein